jgi:hypothetical protein
LPVFGGGCLFPLGQSAQLFLLKLRKNTSAARALVPNRLGRRYGGVHVDVQVAADGRRERRDEAVVIGLRNGIELVVVATAQPMEKPSMALQVVEAMSSMAS